MQAYFIPYSVNNGRYNMGSDEKMLNFCVENKLDIPILRFYGWNPACVSLGRNQKDKNINKEFCSQQGIDIVRRLTGGRALLHDNELTYSFVCPCSFLEGGESVIKSYKEICKALALGFQKLGLQVEVPQEKTTKTKFEYCMSLTTAADLSYKGRKIAGSAQFRKQGYILQHGSVIFDYSPETIEKIFNEKPLENHIAVLNEIDRSITVGKLCSSIKSGFAEFFDLEFKNISIVL